LLEEQAVASTAAATVKAPNNAFLNFFIISP
jgi:hypothetical protein